ncbi:MAG: aldehyde dehydrogenase family protein, partial [Mycobacteriaceae bacterium]
MMTTGSQASESTLDAIPERGSASGATSAHEADDRLGVARKAQHEWGGLSTAERVRVLEALPLILASNLDRIVDVIHEENGKPRSEAMAHEAVPALALARHHLEHTVATLAPREIALPYLPHRKAMRHHRPYGVVVAIAPWNFPFLIPFSQVLPSLFAGNAVVLKPSELT